MLSQKLKSKMGRNFRVVVTPTICGVIAQAQQPAKRAKIGWLSAVAGLHPASKKSSGCSIRQSKTAHRKSKIVSSPNVLSRAGDVIR